VTAPKRIAVLASGNGSNLQALLDHGLAISLVLSDRINVGALARAATHNVEARVLDDYADGKDLLTLLRAHHIDLIALAGYLRHVPDVVTREYRGAILNIHPSLLPAFGGSKMYGLRVHKAAIEAGVRVSGATVHFVDEVYDRGPIVAQHPVPVMPDDTPETLAARVLKVEHMLYPQAVAAVATGHVWLDGDGRVIGTVPAIPDPQHAIYRLVQGEHPSADH
jgi:phosphoribosylglycinamide formyltransferase 1